MAAGDGRPAGYSGTPLAAKLGIKAGGLLMLEGAPEQWATGWPGPHGALPEGAVVRHGLRGGPADIVLGFFDRSGRLEKRLPDLKAKIRQDGMVWLAWPKQASGKATDLTGNVVRAAGLAAGLVDVKVCAIDDTWSGLKFVIRVADRR